MFQWCYVYLWPFLGISDSYCFACFLFVHKVDDELKKIKPKDPKLMTARQRAMLERKTTDKELGSTGEQLLALPTGQLVA